MRPLLLACGISDFACRADVEHRVADVPFDDVAQVARPDVEVVRERVLLGHAALSAEAVENRERELQSPVVRGEIAAAVALAQAFAGEDANRRQAFRANGAGFLPRDSGLKVEHLEVLSIGFRYFACRCFLDWRR